MTIGDLLDALDRNREGYGTVRIIDRNGDEEMRARTSSVAWDGIEDKEIDSMRAAGKDIMDIWLKADR